MITSRQNPRIQWVRQLQASRPARQEAQACLVEGVRLAEEALAAGWPAQLVLYTADLSPRGQEVVGAYRAQGAPTEEVAPEILRYAGETETPQGLLAALSLPAWPVPAALDFALILDGLRDPGNLGTVLRTALAAGVQAVFLAPGAADPFAPKVVRAGMGAHFRLPVFSLDWQAIEQHCQGLQGFAATAGEGLVYTQADFRRPLALIIGSEAEGVSADGLQLAQQQVHIPMPGQAESLNAAIAAGILLFEVLRQRQAS